MEKQELRPYVPGLIDVKLITEPFLGFCAVGFHDGPGDTIGERYAIEVNEELVDAERGVVAVFVVTLFDDGNCLVLLPGETVRYGDHIVLPQSKIYAWSPRGQAKQALYPAPGLG